MSSSTFHFIFRDWLGGKDTDKVKSFLATTIQAYAVIVANTLTGEGNFWMLKFS